MSLAPLALQNSFAMIHKSRVPDANKRGRLFESAVARLAEWWSQEFFIITDEGHIRNIIFEDVNKGLLREGVSLTTPDTVISEEVLQDVLDDDGEQIRNEKSLMKHALMQSGSRDTSAQLFTALCRALGIPSRLVVSLQSVPWQSNAGKPKQSTKKKGKAKAEDNVDNEEDEDMEEVATSSRATPVKSEKAKGKEKAKDTDFDSRSTSRKSRTRVKRRKAPRLFLCVVYPWLELIVSSSF
jgi:xeroderma pigmentosum group C-complementing protein